MNSLFALTPLRTATLLLAVSLAGCSSMDNLMSGEKVDYRSTVTKTQGLEVPPDLTQLAREGRYQPLSGVVSASTMRQPGAAAVAAAAPSVVAPTAVADMRIERQGNSRWLVTKLTPEQLYPQVRSFWTERGFVLALDNPEIGLMETDWAENRAKIAPDLLRRALGSVLDSLYSTPERDKFRTRIERTAGGSEVYISHRGMMEIYTTELKDRTVWQPRPSDPELEAEFLSRLMVKLGAKEDSARAAVAAATPAAPTATLPATSQAARPGTAPNQSSLTLAEGFDRAWRQVGLALDRSGFTVEDRDRGAGLYFVRYVDPKLAGKEANFFSKLFSAGSDAAKPQRLRVLVKSSGNASEVSVQSSDGSADTGETARTIIGKLRDEINR